MKRALTLALALLLALASMAWAESQFTQIAVTDTSKTETLKKPSMGVSICNVGANPAYYRLFDELDTPAAATTAYAPVAAGVCISHSKTVSVRALYKSLSIIAGSGLTTTVNVYHE